MKAALTILVQVACLATCGAVLAKMRRASIQRPPFAPFVFLFAGLGAWPFAALEWPDRDWAVVSFLVLTTAALALFASATYLAFRSERSQYHRIAMWAGFIYPPLLYLYVCIHPPY